MPWIESHQDLRDHPKTVRFRRRLGVSLPAAIGHLHMLWWWALSYADDGDLGQHEADVIAEACGFDGDSESFVEALVYAGFLDEDRRIHDWDDYAGRLVERRQANAERMRQARAARRSRSSTTHAEHVQSTFEERSPDVQGLPDLTGPDLTGPDLTGPDLTGPDPHPKSFPLPSGKDLPPADAGEFPQDVVASLSSLPTDLTAGEFHGAAEAALTELGFVCAREVSVPDRGDGHSGRLDLVAERDGQRIAFELDDRTPRVKSVHKLEKATGYQFRAVVLRCPQDGPLHSVSLSVVVIGAGRPAPAKRSPPRIEPGQFGGTENGTTRRAKPVLNGRSGWMGCPAGCPTNHGGPQAARFLRDDWLAIPTDDRPSWQSFTASHGRPDLAEMPAPAPASQEA